MSSSTGAPNRRHRPSAAIQEFLDPLDPGFYYDSGLARLRGLDDALVAEARSRGRAVGDDAFQLVATDSGVVYCRPSISFAVAARWEELEMAEPIGGDPAILISTWPTHGELRFTTTRRLAENLFHRWAQLHDEGEEPDPVPGPARPVPDRRVPGRPVVDPPVPDRRVLDRQVPEPSRPDRQVPDRQVIAGGGPETWEIVSKLTVGKPRPVIGEVSAAKKVDRRQKPDALRRRRQEQAETAGRGRHPAGTGPRRQAWRQRWLIDENRPASEVPPYDIPPIPTGSGRPPADEAAINRHAISPTVDQAVPSRPTARSAAHAGTTDQSRSSEVQATAAPTSVADENRAPTADRSGRGALADAELRTVPVPVPISVSMPEPNHRSTVTEPSWIGSPASLIGAMVVVSSFVLVATVSVGVYRRTSVTESGVDPAGPSIQVVDHERFSPLADTPGQPPSGVEGTIVVPGSGRLSQTTAPPSPPTTGSGTAPMTSLLEWPPTEGPQTCNSNYSGCVPDVVDVDCPGDGDGPIYWPESAMVMGEDVYELDTDGDGEICEPDQPANAP